MYVRICIQEVGTPQGIICVSHHSVNDSSALKDAADVQEEDIYHDALTFTFL